MEESHFELEELDGERWYPTEVVAVCIWRPGSCAGGRVVRDEFDGDKSWFVISCDKRCGNESQSEREATGRLTGLSPLLTSSHPVPSSPTAPR